MSTELVRTTLNTLTTLNTKERLLSCTHEEADDRIFFHVHHATRVGYCGSIVIASADTDIFVSAAFHYSYLKSIDLKELWIAKSYFPLHELSEKLAPALVEALIPIHGLTGADCLSKV